MNKQISIAQISYNWTKFRCRNCNQM